MHDHFYSNERSLDYFNSIPFPMHIWKMEDDILLLFGYNETAFLTTKGKIHDFLGNSAKIFYKNHLYILKDLRNCIEKKIEIIDEIKIKSKKFKNPTYFIFYFKYIEPDLVSVLIEDITLFKNTESSLKSERERANLYLNTADIIILALDIEGNIILLNKKGYKVLGYQEHELIGKNWFECFIPKSNREEIFKVFKKIISGDIKPVEYYENLIITKSGKEKIIAWNNQILYGKNREIIGTISSGEDITLKKSTEQKLEESENKFKKIIENMPIGVHMYLRDKQGNLIFSGSNSAANKILGRNFDKYIGNNIEDIISEALFLKLSQKFKDVAKSGGFFHREKLSYENGFFNGVLDTINFQTSPNQMVSLFMDITDTIKAERKIKNSMKKYKNAYNKAEFYRDLFTHDINNILHSLLLATEITRKTITNKNNLKEYDQFFRMMSEQIERGKILVKNINKLSLLDEKEMTIAPIELINPLKKMIDRIKEIYKLKNMVIETEIPSVEIYINGNDFIIDIYENLLFNSIKHNKNDPIRIKVKIFKTKIKDDDFVRLEFVDNAKGIPDIEKKKIFAKNKDVVIKTRRIGIGLSIVKKIVNRFKGKIWIEDRIKGNYKEGSSFILIFPIIQN